MFFFPSSESVKSVIQNLTRILISSRAKKCIFVFYIESEVAQKNKSREKNRLQFSEFEFKVVFWRMEIDPMDERELYNKYNRSDNTMSTTISTIVVQGGPLQLVIALLRVRILIFKWKKTE